MAKFINENIKEIEKILLQDMNLIEEAEVVMKRVSNGWYSQLIENSTSNNTLEEFKNNVNTMIECTKNRFIQVDNILKQYAKHNYIVKLKMNKNDEQKTNLEKNVFKYFIDKLNKVDITLDEIRMVSVSYTQAQFWCNGTGLNFGKFGVYLAELLANERCEIIGNIHSNPELVEVQK